VDDEYLVRALLVTHLEDEGYDTIEASSASEAIEIMENDNTVRAVFTDINMPGTMDGVGLDHCVRNRWPPTYIVICSGQLPKDRSAFPKNVGVLPKPC